MHGMASDDTVIRLPPGPRACPICGKPAVPRQQPFCSLRCAQLDLGRWLKGAYRVETDEPAEDSAEPSER